MRVVIIKTSGKLIEMQSHAKEGFLTKKAVDVGYKFDEIEEKEVTEEEYEKIQSEQFRPNVLSKDEKNRADIDYLSIMLGVDLNV